MGNNTLKAVAFLAIIIGATGVGFGAFTAWQVQTGAIKGQDGDDGDDGTTSIVYVNILEYPCSSEAEINDALTAIGTGYGIITITNNITLSGTIDISGGGNYIIQGAGAFLICSNGQKAFDVSNAKSLTIQNIRIDTTDVTVNNRNIILINEASDNPIYISNVHIIGDDNTKGRGICINSDNVWVSKCYFYKVRIGIRQDDGKKAHILDNVIDDFADYGIYTNGANNFIDGNLLNNTGLEGIYTDTNSHYNSISNNIIYYFIWHGIRIATDYNIIVGNNIENETATGTCAGIYIIGSYNTIDSNGCYNIDAPSFGIGFGIDIAGGTNNTVVGNTCLFTENPFYESGGTDTYVSGNQFY
jgi:hypothetical protein